MKSEVEKAVRDYWIYRSMAAQRKYNVFYNLLYFFKKFQVILANFEGQAAHRLIQPLLHLAEFHTGKKTA